MRVRKKIKEREKGFDGDEAAKILAATQGPFSHLISVEMKAARRWLPWIALYASGSDALDQHRPFEASVLALVPSFFQRACLSVGGANNPMPMAGTATIAYWAS